MWDAGQKRTFAKTIIATDLAASAQFLSPTMRNYIVEAFCFGIVRQQVAETVSVAAMDDLVEGVKTCIKAKLGYTFFG